MIYSNEIDSLGSKIQINRIRPLKVGKIDFSRKPLEQEPCDDCISRHAALETIDNRIKQLKRDVNEINKSYSHLSFAEGIHDGYCRLKCDLRILSSVKPQPKIGHWIDVAGGCECSECGCLEAGYSNFCPDCGAKMEEEKE